LFAQKKQSSGKEAIFYLLVGLILFFALIKVVFEKYLQNLFKVFFRASLKQKQIREQLLQTPLPSLMLNIFFVVVLGVFAAFLLKYYHFTIVSNFWWLLLYCVVAMGILYLGKFLVLKFTGWVFNLSEATDTYIFIVFLINKLLAVALLPLLVLMAFAASTTTVAWVTLAYVAIVFSFLYRYFSSYEPVRREIKVNQLHFFLYLCAFELAPLVLIYKVLINFLERTV
jgi:MFS family permease